jgi:hypothetical protein
MGLYFMKTERNSHQKNLQILGLDLDPDLELDPDPHLSNSLFPDPHIMNADPKQCC